MVGGLILLKAGSELTRSHALLVASLSFSANDCLAPMPGRRTPLPGAIFAGPGCVEDPANGLVLSCGTRAAAVGAGVGWSRAGTGSNDSSRGDWWELKRAEELPDLLQASFPIFLLGRCGSRLLLPSNGLFTGCGHWRRLTLCGPGGDTHVGTLARGDQLFHLNEIGRGDRNRRANDRKIKGQV